MSFRTDRHNNPAAFTVDVAIQAGLSLNVDYTVGEPFAVTYNTARLLADPVALTIRVIDKIGYTTKHGAARWAYINLPKFVWDGLTYEEKRDVIGFHYRHEGGTEMIPLFPNYATCL